MIKLIIGGIGQGKTVSAVKEMYDRNVLTYSNFPLKKENMIRLRVDHIIKENITVSKTGREKKTLNVNWDYWNDVKKKGTKFDIMIDEAHNILHSRRSMTKFSVLMSMFLAQIRKVLSDSTDYHLYLITQRLGGIDIAVRELCHEIIYVSKKETSRIIKTKVQKGGKIVEIDLPEIWIQKIIFRGNYCLDKFEAYLSGIDMYDSKEYFIANDYFYLYNTYELIDFGSSEYI